MAYFSLSPTAPHKMSRRKYPLTPPCVSPPALTTYSSRPELNRSQTTPKATTLLSKVALTSSSRRGSPTGSPPGSPSGEKMLLGEKSGEQRFEARYREKEGRVDRIGAECGEEMQYWRGSEQREGYISFPDFERYCQQYEQGSQEQLEQGQQTPKT